MYRFEILKRTQELHLIILFCHERLGINLLCNIISAYIQAFIFLYDYQLLYIILKKMCDPAALIITSPPLFTRHRRRNNDR